MQDTLKIRQYQADLVNQSDMIRKLEDQLGDIDVSNIPRQLQVLDVQRRKLKENVSFVTLVAFGAFGMGHFVTTNDFVTS